MIDIVHVLIDDSSDKRHTGIITFDRDAGGSLLPPSGSAFPLSPVAGELFWNTLSGTLYRRNETNTEWDTISAGSSSGGQITASLGIDMASASIGSAKTIGFDREYDNGNCGAATTIDWSKGQKQVLTLTASMTASFLRGNVGNYLLRVVQGSSGGPFTIEWPSTSTVKWANGQTPPISSGSNKIDIYTFYCNGNVYFGIASLNFA